MSAPTQEEQRLLVEFRQRVHDILEKKHHKKDTFLLRWLRARDLDLNQAEGMLKASLAWRKEHRISFILDVPMDPYFDIEFPYYINGVDKKGQPVLIIPIGRYDYDIRKCVADGRSEEFKRRVITVFENVNKTIEKTNKERDPDLYPITQFTTIMDWKGYYYTQLCSFQAVQNILYTAVAYEAHYPEVLSSCLFINCPGFFSVLLTMIKRILASKTFGKISVYGSNREEWEYACREIIDDNQLKGILELLS